MLAAAMSLWQWTSERDALGRQVRNESRPEPVSNHRDASGHRSGPLYFRRISLVCRTQLSGHSCVTARTPEEDTLKLARLVYPNHARRHSQSLSHCRYLGTFTPVLSKQSKSFKLIDCVSVGVDRMQRNYEPMRKPVEAWQKSELTDVTLLRRRSSLSVDHSTILEAQEILRSRTGNKCNEELIEPLRTLPAREDRFSRGLIKSSADLPSPSTYRGRFGSLRRAYELIGYSA